MRPAEGGFNRYFDPEEFDRCGERVSTLTVEVVCSKLKPVAKKVAPGG